MTSARHTPQTTCVTARRTSTPASAVTRYRSGRLEVTSSGRSGGVASTAVKRRAFKNADGAIITGTSATDVVSIGEQFQFPMPGNG